MKVSDINLIGLSFHDNDFYNTFIPFLSTLREALYWGRGEDIDKETICKLWNESCISFYRLFQNRWEYNHDEDINHIKNYLQLDESNIHINEEVSVFIGQGDYCYNGEYFFIEISSGQTNSK